MTPKKLENLIRVKSALADKYTRLAGLCHSQPRTDSWMLQAKKHRAAAETLKLQQQRKAKV